MPTKSAEYQRRWREKNKAHEKAYRAAYVERNRDEVNEKARQRSKAWYAKNAEQAKAAARERKPSKAVKRARYQANRERVLEQEKARRNTDHYRGTMVRIAANRRAKALSAGPPLSAEAWADIRLVFDDRCAYCLAALKRPQMEHFRPLAQGGDHSPDNIVPACGECNSRKGGRLVFEWLPLINQRGRSMA